MVDLQINSLCLQNGGQLPPIPYAYCVAKTGSVAPKCSRIKMEWLMNKVMQLSYGEQCICMSCNMWVDSFSYLISCLLYTSPSPRDAALSRMPSSA